MEFVIEIFKLNQKQETGNKKR